MVLGDTVLDSECFSEASSHGVLDWHSLGTGESHIQVQLWGNTQRSLPDCSSAIKKLLDRDALPPRGMLAAGHAGVGTALLLGHFFPSNPLGPQDLPHIPPMVRFCFTPPVPFNF